MSYGKRLQLLAKPSFRWYAISCLLATLGGGLSYITMSWLILQADNSVSSIAALMLCFWVPMVLLGPLLGVVADRYSRKWLMVFANGLRAVILIAFGICLRYHLSATMIYVLMAILGACFSVYLPAALALIREVVDRDDLLYANSTIDIAYELGNVVGMGSAGIIVAVFSGPTAILISGILFVFCTVALFMVRIKMKTPEKPSCEPVTTQLINDFRLGLDYLASNSQLIIIYCVQLLILVGVMTTPVLLAPFVKNILHASVGEFGRIEAALSVGVVIGGICIPWIAKRWGLIQSLMVICLLLACCFALFGMNRHITIAELLYLFIGFGLSVWPLIVTKAQKITHIDFQARVQSVFSSISGILILAMYLLVSLTSHFIAISMFYGFEVILALLAAFLLWRHRAYLYVDGPDPNDVNSI